MPPIFAIALALVAVSFVSFFLGYLITPQDAERKNLRFLIMIGALQFMMPLYIWFISWATGEWIRHMQTVTKMTNAIILIGAEFIATLFGLTWGIVKRLRDWDSQMALVKKKRVRQPSHKKPRRAQRH
jgi:hypothetical protein